MYFANWLKNSLTSSLILVGIISCVSFAESSALIQTIDAWQWLPPSPDSAGIVYLPTANSLLVADSEVSEMPIFTGDNLFEATLTGDLIKTLTTISFSDEPTGVTFNFSNGHLFFSDDDARSIYELDPGPDGLYDTSDDIITSFSTGYFGSRDPEGVTFANEQGVDVLFIADGVNREVYRVEPGDNGFFDGVDDQVTSFDTAGLGLDDPEGIAFNHDNGNLYVVGRPPNTLFEITTAGALVQTIDISAANAENPAGLAYAPSSSAPNLMSIYIVDRGVDNDSDPNENDGKVYEFSLNSVAQTPDGYIIDNGNAETSSTGTWSRSGGANYYGRKSVFAKAAGATYTFQTFFPGEVRDMEVYQWWTYWSNRCTSTRIEIYDAEGLIDTFYVNQKENENQWNYLETYQFDGGAALRIISEGGCSVNADAVKFVTLGSGDPPVYECSDGIDNDGDGLIDYPSDPGCTSATDNDEYNAPPTYECSDGIDNDGDGLIDYPSDPGCTSATDNDEYNATSSDEYIIDNGDTETSSTGTWSRSGGANYYGRKSVFAKAAGATYTFQTFFPGEVRDMEVYQWWTYWSNRCTSTRIEIYDAEGLIDTFYVNQKGNESQWNYLGTYQFDGGAALSIISEGGCSVNADAVKFVTLGSGDPPVYECSDGIDNDGDGLIDYPSDPGCTSATDNDEYNAPPTYECSDGIDNDGDGLIDYPSDPGCTSATDNDEYNATSSDEYIIDNGDTETSSTGTWSRSGGANYYGRKSVFAKAAGATYTFQTFFPGEVRDMEVYQWWTYWSNRCTSTRIEIYDAEGLIDTFYVNQKGNESQWNYLGTYQFDGGAALRIISEGGCTVNADAVKFK